MELLLEGIARKQADNKVIQHGCKLWHGISVEISCMYHMNLLIRRSNCLTVRCGFDACGNR